jgi:4-diphosphocytidyl-2-C-methyl-D-erythritol kinase
VLTLKAPAKINLLLHVLGRRPDGYHQILSLAQQVDLADTLRFSPLEEDRLVLEAPGCPVPPEQNLALQAARLLKEHTGCPFGARIELRKEIPLQAGLGGGSSDAAAVLRGLNRLWGLGLPTEELQGLALRLGSDVPFFLNGPLALLAGRGEELRPLRMEARLHVLLLKPPFGIPTAQAYRGLGDYSELTKAQKNIKLFIRALGGHRPGRLELQGNDLERWAAQRFPQIARLKEALYARGAWYAGMSGSGSAVFGLFDTLEAAQEAAEAFGGLWHKLCQSL